MRFCINDYAPIYIMVNGRRTYESLQTTEDTAKNLPSVLSYPNTDYRNIKSIPLSLPFKPNESTFVQKYQRKYYYRVMIESDGVTFPIIYTIDGKNGNLISRGTGNEVIFYSEEP